MRRRLVLSFTLLTALCAAAYITLARVSKYRGSSFIAKASGSPTQGALKVLNPEKGGIAECPLKHTAVKAEISGFMSRVVVTQEFENSFKEKIEAVYTFPLPHSAAVDDMTLRIDRKSVV